MTIRALSGALSLLLICAGCGLQRPNVSALGAIEHSAAQEIPLATAPSVPYAARASALKPYLPAAVADALGPGPCFVDAVHLKDLPNFPYVFLENRRAVVVARLAAYSSLAAMPRSVIKAYVNSSRNFFLVERLAQNRSYARMIQNIVGLDVRVLPIAALPAPVRFDVPGQKAVSVVSFVVMAPPVPGTRRFDRLTVTSIVLWPGTDAPAASYSQTLPMPSSVASED